MKTDTDLIRQEIIQQAIDETLHCRQAFAIAEKHAVSPAIIGKLCDEIPIKIIGCQLGCF